MSQMKILKLSKFKVLYSIILYILDEMCFRLEIYPQLILQNKKPSLLLFIKIFRFP